MMRPGKPEIQSEEEYKKDPNFQAIDEKIRNENDLSQYDITSVSKQLVNGYIYIITYRGPDGKTKLFRALITPNN